jgi:hypothetical protein
MTITNINVTTAFALLVWPIVALWLYSNRPLAQATTWTILGGYLLLPGNAGIKLEMIPAFDKSSIPAFIAFFACMVRARRFPGLSKGFGVVEVLFLILITSAFITGLLNDDTISIRRTILPGVGLYDAGSVVIFQVIVLIPFFLGRHLMRSARDIEDILRSLVFAALGYSLLMLIEIRLSPVLHIWVYGYFPSSDIMQSHFLDAGFRPAVFVGSGLALAFFTMTAVVAAAALSRTQRRIARLPLGGATAYLGAVLILCKGLASIVYGTFLAPLVRWVTPRMQIRVAVILVMIALSYPILRTMDLVPTTFMLDVAGSVDAQRAGSLEVRFTNERRLLDHASERFWFGWGRFGRSRVYNEDGYDASLTDGYWIITMGQYGFIGFLASFGLLVLPVFRAASALRFAESMSDRINLAALTVIIAAYVVDLLPNAGLSPWSWLLTGALLGRAEALHIRAREPVKLELYQAATPKISF